MVMQVSGHTSDEKCLPIFDELAGENCCTKQPINNKGNIVRYIFTRFRLLSVISFRFF